MGGSNYKDNIVKLTPEEHFVAHQLLVKMYPDNLKLLHAANSMTRSSKSQKRNNKMYGWLKKKRSEKMRKWALENNIRPPVRNKPHREETKRKISEGTKGRKASYSMLGRKGKDNPNFGKKHSEERKKKQREPQQRFYELMSPTNEKFFLKSFELKKFCKENQISWGVLMRVKLEGRIRKNNWNLKEIPAIPKPIARATKPGVDF